VLQCVAVCCSVLQCVVVCLSLLRLVGGVVSVEAGTLIASQKLSKEEMEAKKRARSEKVTRMIQRAQRQVFGFPPPNISK